MDYYKTWVDESLRRLGLLPLAAKVWQVIQESGHSLFFTRPVCQETKYYIAKTNHIPYMDIKALMCCYNSRHPYLKAFHKILQAGFRNLAPVSHKSFSKIGHWCWVMRLGLQMIFQVIPKSVGMLWGQGSTEEFLHQTGEAFLSWHCYVETGQASTTVATKLETHY